MKHIDKNIAPEGLKYACAHHFTWDDFHNNCPDKYVECREQAYSEQNGECAYTGLPLTVYVIVHLDHFKKKSIYPRLTFDWSNLFAAVKDNHFGSDYKDKQINGNNATHYYKLLINPALDTPEAYFWYSNDGRVQPKDDLSQLDIERANITIRLFNLNQSTLVQRRRALWKILQDYKDLPTDTITSELKIYGFSFVISNYLL